MTGVCQDLVTSHFRPRERGIGFISMNQRCQYKNRDNEWVAVGCRIVLKPKEGGRNGCSRI
jgi:hypothetical protein